MIKRASELTQKTLVGLRGGKGNVVITNFIEDEQFQGKGRLFGKVVLAPGHSIGYHQHIGDVEACYILSGEGTLSDNDTISTIRTGDVFFTGNGESHSIENTGISDLIIIALVILA